MLRLLTASILGVSTFGPGAAAEHPDQTRDRGQYMISLASDELGVREAPGGQNNPRVQAYLGTLSETKLPDSTAWCSGFVAHIALRAGYEVRHANLSARSWLREGRGVDTPRPGDVVVFWRGDPNSWTGHVAFFLKVDGDQIIVLGGNQSDAVTIKAYPRAQVLGFRRL
ncbi:MAG: TIGR02594 family protein [Pseudomonadota bacterium]